MTWRKLILALLIVAGLAGVIYVAAGLFVPSQRRLIFGVDKYTGSIRIVDQRVTWLPWHRFYRMTFEKREGSAQTDGAVVLTTPDEIPVSVFYRLRFNVAADRLADTNTLVSDGWSEWLRRRVSEAVSAVATQIPIEEFASPLTDYTRQRNVLHETVSNHLSASGLEVTAFHIERFEIDRDALLQLKRRELRRHARGTFSRVALFGIDGADWELITSLVRGGAMPNLEALIDSGTTGILQSIQPTAGPVVWTTMATGVAPDRHGVLDYFDRRQELTPIDARYRSVPALWEIATAFQRPATTVNWWTAWPPTQFSGTVAGVPVVDQPNAVYPQEHLERTRQVHTPEQTIEFQQISRFVNVPESAWREAAADPTHPVSLLRSILSSGWSSHRAALELYRATQPALMMKLYEGPDTINHLFGPYHPPFRQGVDTDEFRRYWPAVATYYSEVDRMLGEWRQTLDHDTTILIVSAHGMAWGPTRPRRPPESRIALGDHRLNGIFIASGNLVSPSRLRRNLSIYDIAPSVLALLGLPQADEMPGEFISWAFENVEPVTGILLHSYHDLLDRSTQPVSVGANEAQYRSRLEAIGHVGDPSRVQLPANEGEQGRPEVAVTPERWGLYAYLNNQAISLRSEEQWRHAIAAFEQAIELNPARPTPHLNLAMLNLERQFYSVAEDHFINAVEAGLPNADEFFLDFAAWYRDNDMPTRAINVLIRARQVFPENHRIAASLGGLLASVNRVSEGQAELERALALQPSSTLVLNNLGVLYARRNDYARALDLWNRSLVLNPRQPEIREAAEAVRARL
jgi:predicted AlkP superfamily phosphohydrolase/phosphomutase/Tfp pilus assembly protein PilF